MESHLQELQRAVVGIRNAAIWMVVSGAAMVVVGIYLSGALLASKPSPSESHSAEEVARDVLQGSTPAEIAIRATEAEHDATRAKLLGLLSAVRWLLLAFGGYKIVDAVLELLKYGRARRSLAIIGGAVRGAAGPPAALPPS